MYRVEHISKVYWSWCRCCESYLYLEAAETKLSQVGVKTFFFQFSILIFLTKISVVQIGFS